MQIIKNGDKERLKRPLYFECKNCGCEFKANYEEKGDFENENG